MKKLIFLVFFSLLAQSRAPQCTLSLSGVQREVTLSLLYTNFTEVVYASALLDEVMIVYESSRDLQSSRIPFDLSRCFKLIFRDEVIKEHCSSSDKNELRISEYFSPLHDWLHIECFD